MTEPGHPKHSHWCVTCFKDFHCYDAPCVSLSIALCPPCARRLVGAVGADG